MIAFELGRWNAQGPGEQQAGVGWIGNRDRGHRRAEAFGEAGPGDNDEPAHGDEVDDLIKTEVGSGRLKEYVVFEVRGDARPPSGWPSGVAGAQGSVRPIECGYYDTDLRLIDGEWKIVHHRVLSDLPFAIPDV